MRLPFDAALTGEMFWSRKDKIFKELPHVFSIVYAMLVIEYNKSDTDHDGTVCRLLQVYRKENLELNKKMNAISDTQVSHSFGKIIEVWSAACSMQIVHAYRNMTPSNKKRN